MLGLALANGLVALSGALLSQYQGFAEINMGRGAIVIGLAAIIIGDVLFGKLFKNFALKMRSDGFFNKWLAEANRFTLLVLQKEILYENCPGG